MFSLPAFNRQPKRTRRALVCLSSVLIFSYLPASLADVGQPFFHGCTNPIEIRVRAAHWLDGITTICGDGQQFRAGGDGGTEYAFKLQQGEVITRISGSKTAPGFPYVITLQIHTNFRSSPIYGGQGTLVAEETFDEPLRGDYFTGLHGIAGPYVNDIHLGQPTRNPPRMSSNLEQGGHNQGGRATGGGTSAPPGPDPVNTPPSPPPPAPEPQQVQRVKVMIRNSNPVQMGVYVDDLQAGLVHQVGLPFQSSYVNYYPVGTSLVFGPEGGAAVKFYTVGSNPEQTVEIKGELQQVGTQAPAKSQDQSHTSATPTPTTQATLSYTGPTEASLVAGLGIIDDSTRGALLTHYRTEVITLRTAINDGDEQFPVVLELHPEIFAWIENGSTHIRVDTHGSEVRVENIRDSGGVQRSFYIDSIDIITLYPQLWQRRDYFPNNQMDSFQVSDSVAFSIGASAGPHPFMMGVSASLTASRSASGSVPEYKAETSHREGRTTTHWRLCAAPGQSEKGGRTCLYNQSSDLAVWIDQGSAMALSELPNIARNFSILRHTFAVSQPGISSDFAAFTIHFRVNLVSARVEDLIFVRSKSELVEFQVALWVDLAQLANTAQALELKHADGE